MPKLDLDAIKARASVATKGPWSDDTYIGEDPYDDPDQPFVQVGNVRWVAGEVEIPAAIQQKRDAEFMAHARTDIPALIARVREMEGENEALKRLFCSPPQGQIASPSILEMVSDDNAALRLAATELYEFLVEESPHAGFSLTQGPIGRMAQVLGIKDGKEPAE